MTREEFKKHIRNLFYSSKTVEKYLEQAYADIDKIYNDHEAQLKGKDRRITELEAEFEAKDKALRVAENACILGLEAEEEYLRQLQAKDDEIEMLKAIIEEAIY